MGKRAAAIVGFLLAFTVGLFAQGVTQATVPWVVSFPSPQAVTLTSTTITGTVAVTQSTSPWVVGDGAGSLTVDGTVTANQGGTWDINNISGTVSLPTGASTLAEQQTQTTALQLIDNLPLAQGSTTSGQSGVLMQGAVTTGAPTYTTGNTNPASLTVEGAIRVEPWFQGVRAVTDVTGVQKVTIATTGGNAFDFAINGLNSTGCCAFASQGIGQFDDVTPTAITENRFGNLRISANRNLYNTIRDAAGNERGLNVDANGEVGIGAIRTSVTPGTGATNLGKAEDAAATSGDTGVPPLWVRRDSATVLTSAVDEYVNPAADAYGMPYARLDHVNRIRCTISSTATTSTIVTGCSAPGAGLSIYLTGINWSSSIISTTANFMRIQSGTGGACGTATTVLYDGYIQAAFGSQSWTLNTPIKATANHEICFVHASAGTRLVNLTGFIAQ